MRAHVARPWRLPASTVHSAPQESFTKPPWRELIQRLGVDWTTPVNDACDIAGIPRRLVRPFSTRHEEIEIEIEIELERLGESGFKAGDDASLATRESTAAIDAEGIVSR